MHPLITMFTVAEDNELSEVCAREPIIHPLIAMLLQLLRIMSWAKRWSTGA